MVDRSAVVQEVLDLFERPSYLEIGVDAGDTFRFVSAAYKAAVDPDFKFEPPPNTAGVAYFPMTSDEFFADCGPARRRFDVVYVDGLHTFEQTLRDVMNALLVLNRGGVVIVDDIIPLSFHAALSSLDEAFQVRDHLAASQPSLTGDNTWMGDVYKVAFFIETFLQQLSYATVLENHGQLILWQSPRPAESIGRRTMLDVALLNFADTVLQRRVFRIQPFAAILDEIQASKTNL